LPEPPDRTDSSHSPTLVDWKPRHACRTYELKGTIEIAKKLVELCKQGKNMEALDILFADDVVSVEAVAMPSVQQEMKPRGCEGKGRVVARQSRDSFRVRGPRAHEERFVVAFQYDVTNKPSEKRMKMDEVGLYTVRNEKIVREHIPGAKQTLD
jgi:hypothetical protein